MQVTLDPGEDAGEEGEFSRGRLSTGSARDDPSAGNARDAPRAGYARLGGLFGDTPGAREFAAPGPRAPAWLEWETGFSR